MSAQTQELRISNWRDEKKIFLEEFILDEKEYPSIYSGPKFLYEEYLKQMESRVTPKKLIHPPVVQLSPKGIALTSYLYSLKDKNEAQPLVASTQADLRRIVTMIDNAPIGVDVTVIFQPTDVYSGRDHKTVGKFVKTADGIRCINMDSIVNPKYDTVFLNNITTALRDNANQQNRTKTRLYIAFQNNPTFESGNAGNTLLSRQVDEYQCGTYAIKDGRQIAKDSTIFTKVFDKNNKTKIDNGDYVLYDYDIPPEFLKPVQSSIYREVAAKKHGEKVVTRKGKTLSQVFDKYKNIGYVNKFSQKLLAQVTTFIDKHKDNPSLLRAVTEKYDAGKITDQDLARIYMSKNVEEYKKKVEEEIIQNPFYFYSWEEVLLDVMPQLDLSQDAKTIENTVVSKWREVNRPCFLFKYIADAFEITLKCSLASSLKLGAAFIDSYETLSELNHEDRIMKALENVVNMNPSINSQVLLMKENLLDNLRESFTIIEGKGGPKLYSDDLKQLRQKIQLLEDKTLVFSSISRQSQQSDQSQENKQTQEDKKTDSSNINPKKI